MSKIAVLKRAAELCRAREAGWRELGEKGGDKMHPESHCFCRAYEAMSCVEIIESLIEREVK